MHSTRRTAKKRDIYCFVYYNSHIRVSIVVGVSVRVVSWSRRPAAPPVVVAIGRVGRVVVIVQLLRFECEIGQAGGRRRSIVVRSDGSLNF